MSVGVRMDIEGQDFDKLPPGGYGWCEKLQRWFCRVPDERFFTGSLRSHQVTEHEDGTITVNPSILCGDGEGNSWHGWLIKGEWSEVK